jgi:hypothetical protein
MTGRAWRRYIHAGEKGLLEVCIEDVQSLLHGEGLKDDNGSSDAKLNCS